MNLKDNFLVEDVEELIKSKHLDAEIIWHEQYGQKTEDAAEALGVDKSSLVKSLIFIDEGGCPLMVIVTGNRRVDTKKVQKLAGSKVRIANADEVLKLTKHPVGGVPPIGLKIRTLVDNELMQKDFVYSSAGSPHAGLKIHPKDLVKISKAEVCDVAER
ncbi:MAG: YbaK/EbsC family protein [Candidatus Aenigmarchaeota archaeon]|nr:YbaK/EbsC family protein [Candidatus Aenigmarchaeota archaeon]